MQWRKPQGNRPLHLAPFQMKANERHTVYPIVTGRTFRMSNWLQIPKLGHRGKDRRHRFTVFRPERAAWSRTMNQTVT